MKKAALLAIAACVLVCGFTYNLPAAVSKSAAKITRLEGRAWVNGRPASTGTVVMDGDWVVTGRKSTCEIIFAEKNILRLSDETRMKMSISGEEKTLEIVRGAFAALARGLGGLGNRRRFALSVKTPTAVCGVRGTAFFVKVEDSLNSYVCLCNGKMRVEAAQGKEAVEAEAIHHKAFRLTARADSVGLTPAGMIYHTDDGMESLAAGISEKMDWTKAE